ncbi:MAG: rod shape-determining protein MreD [Bacteroidales bacterium]|jgi:rod shape-determining protein MreD|nr:rod shape-determining protein MreD [Bacteroidales bacterium]
MNLSLQILLRFIILVALQVFILNNIHFGGYINPYLYVLFVLMLPYEIPGWALLALSFILGYTIDIFTNTPGMHLAATVFMAFSRPAVLRLLTQKQEYDPGSYPSLGSMGLQTFFTYAFLLVFIHHTSLFLLEVFRFSEILQTLMRSGLSMLFTMLLIIIAQYLFYTKH